ncbi:MAG: hypothetical protein ACLTMP_14930 [Eggerthella lenta]
MLVDWLWPRGLTKARVHYDEWAKFLAPQPNCGRPSATTHPLGHFPRKYVAERRTRGAKVREEGPAPKWPNTRVSP